MIGSCWSRIAVGVGVCASPFVATAQPEQRPAESADASPDGEAALEKAKELFRRGNELRKAGDCQAALVLYLSSRELVPSAANTMNAAFCLHQLRRADEALGLYEELISRFSMDLTEQDRAAIAPTMVELRRSTGSLELSANVAGAVVIDGRMRGTLPLLAPIRLNAGRHVVRVIKDGFQTYERTIEVEPGSTQSLDAVVARLERSGALRIECPDLAGADVFIDGANLGSCPYEGALDPGPHLVWTRLGSRGSNPTRVDVVLGQTTRLTSTSRPLGPELRVMTNPSSAKLSLDGVSLDTSSFQGPLTLGDHVFIAQEVGYEQGRIAVRGDRGGEVLVTLTVDSAHPRWAVSAPAPAPGVFSIGADAAFVAFAGEGGDAARRCSGDCAADVPLGIRGLIRGAWTSLSGVGVGVDAGGQFLRAAQSARSITLNPVGLPGRRNLGEIGQQVDWASFLVGASTFYRRGGEWPLSIGAGVGFSIGSVSALREGDFTNSSGTTYSAAQDHGSAATHVYVMPEATFGRQLGDGAELFVAAAMMSFFAVETPTWDNRSIVPTSPNESDRGDGGALFEEESLLGDMTLAANLGLGVRWEIP